MLEAAWLRGWVAAGWSEKCLSSAGIIVVFSLVLLTLRALGADFWSLLAHFGGLRAHCGCLLVTLEPIGVHFEVFGLHLRGPWDLLGLILDPIGFILWRLGHPKVTQSGPGWHLADML